MHVTVKKNLLLRLFWIIKSFKCSKLLIKLSFHRENNKSNLKKKEKMHMSKKCAWGEKIKFHPGQPTSTLTTAGLLERSVIRYPVVRTRLLKNNAEPTLGQFSKMKNEHKSTICVLVGVFKSNL